MPTLRTDPTYKCWLAMLYRCEHQNHPNYHLYGGRGIQVCKRWHEFELFVSDMGERPEGRVLDRENNDGNYEPGNCRWVTALQSSQNRRTTKLTKTQVERIRSLSGSISQKEIARRFGVSQPHVSRIITGQKWPQ